MWTPTAVQIPVGSTTTVIPNLVGVIGLLVLSFSSGGVFLVGVSGETTPTLTAQIGSELSLTSTPTANALGLEVVGSQLQLFSGAAYSGSYVAYWMGFGSIVGTNQYPVGGSCECI